MPILNYVWFDSKPTLPSFRDNDGTSRPTDITFKNQNQLFKTKEEKMKYHPLSRRLVILLLLLSFALYGCGGGEEDDSDETEGRSSEIISEDEETENENEGEDED
jgi:hypothetical protein